MNNNQNSMKKIIIIGLIAFIFGSMVIWYTSTKKIVTPQVEEVLDLSKLEVESTRTDLLNEVAGENYSYSNTYLLDDNDPSTRVTIGAYTRYGIRANPGGIIMLKRLPNGKDSIFWEIISPYFRGGEPAILFVKDINNDGLKEIVTVWRGDRLGDNFSERGEFTQFFYWILTVDPHKKTYKVLNPITDEDSKSPTNFNFEQLDPSKNYYNKFNALLSYGIDTENIIKDIDNDGISEIIIDDYDSKKTYKWNGKEYYLWKEEVVK